MLKMLLKSNLDAQMLEIGDWILHIDSIKLNENNALGLDFSMNRLHHMIHMIYLYFETVFFSMEPHDNPMWDSPNVIAIPFSAGHIQHGDSQV